MKWIDQRLKPTNGKDVLCYCPGWNESGYQVAYWTGKKWTYDGVPNAGFTKYVESWMLFMEAD